MIDELNKYLPRLIKTKALPFMDKINWQLDVNFPYDEADTSSSASDSSSSQSKKKATSPVRNKKRLTSSEDSEEDEL